MVVPRLVSVADVGAEASGGSRSGRARPMSTIGDGPSGHSNVRHAAGVTPFTPDRSLSEEGAVKKGRSVSAGCRWRGPSSRYFGVAD